MLFLVAAICVCTFVNICIHIKLKKDIDNVNQYLKICDKKLSDKQASLSGVVKQVNHLSLMSSIIMSKLSDDVVYQTKVVKIH